MHGSGVFSMLYERLFLVLVSLSLIAVQMPARRAPRTCRCRVAGITGMVLTHQKIPYHLTIRDDAKIKILKSKNSMKILFLKNILLLDGFQPFSLLSSDTNMVLSLKRSKKM